MEETKPCVVVVIPAYNAARTLYQAYLKIPPGAADKIILVDDNSQDNTVEVAKGLGLDVIRHFHNAGYGQNQKTCYLEALRQGADAVIMLHGDDQYPAGEIHNLVAPLLAGTADVCLGSRFLIPGGPQKGGMPWWKFLANRFLTETENAVLGLRLSEYHTGYRAFSRKFLETVPFLRNSNDFVFDTEMLIQAAAFKFPIAEIPIETRYFPEASSINFRVSSVYGLKTLWALTRYRLHKLGLRSSKYRR